MRLASVVMIAIAACRGSTTPGPTATVIVEAGLDPAAGATVISHRPTGEVIDEVMADGVGQAEVVIEANALISVVFPATMNDVTQPVSLVTTLPPPTGAELVIYGPPQPATPSTAGALQIMPAEALAGADHYLIELGCATIQETALPATVDVSSLCTGSDINLDALVVGYDGTTVAGYAAGRVPLQDGVATFAPASWSIGGVSVPIALTGVQPVIDWTFYADGLAFGNETIAGAAQLWTGLAVDRTQVRATIGGQITTSEVAGTPTAIAFAASDFLDPIAPTLALDTATLAATWATVDLPADAIDLRVTWATTDHDVTWDVVLPPDATAATFPALASDLAGSFEPPTATPGAVLRYIDSTDLDGFAALVAAGIASDTIVPRPATGEIRISQVALPAGQAR